jgi:hypothetical protein
VETPTDSRRAVRAGLQKLTQNRGVWRSDLPKLLVTDLAELVRILKINPQEDPKVVRRRIIGTLTHIIPRLDPRNHRQRLSVEQRRDQYQQLVSVCFNIDPIEEVNPDNLQQRRAWLADPRRKPLTISISTGQEDLDHAIDRIADILLDGIDMSSSKNSPSDRPADDETDTARRPPGGDTEAASSLLEASPTKSRWKRRTKILVAVATTVSTLCVAAIVWTTAFSDPKSLSVQLSPFDFREGQGTSPNLVIPTRVNDLDRPPLIAGADTKTFDEWAEKHGAVFAESMMVSFVARSESTQPTIITDARVEVVKRQAPLQGTWIVPDGAGTQPVRQLYADLNKDPPTITLDPSWQFPLRVSDSDPELFTVNARSRNCYCSWRIVLSALLPDGESVEVVVDNNGRPFEVTSTGNTTDKTYLPRFDGDIWPRPNA